MQISRVHYHRESILALSKCKSSQISGLVGLLAKAHLMDEWRCKEARTLYCRNNRYISFLEVSAKSTVIFVVFSINMSEFSPDESSNTFSECWNMLTYFDDMRSLSSEPCVFLSCRRGASTYLLPFVLPVLLKWIHRVTVTESSCSWERGMAGLVDTYLLSLVDKPLSVLTQREANKTLWVC